MGDPRAVVYGYYEPHESLAVGEESAFEAIAADLATLQECSTVAEIRAALPTLGPARRLIDEEDLVERADDEPWAWDELWQVADGDWPPMPTEAIREVFPTTDPIWADLRAKVGAEEQDTTLNGTYVWIDSDKEEELLEVLRAHGVSASRDDGLILSASMYA